jgi:hypothetical protein
MANDEYNPMTMKKKNAGPSVWVKKEEDDSNNRRR